MFKNIVFIFLFILHGVFGVDGDEVKSVSVMEGDSVTLHTDITQIQNRDQILWSFGPHETRIAEIYKGPIDMFDSNEIFGDRLKLNSQNGFLTISNIKISDSGLYKLLINSNRGPINKIFNVTVYAPLPVPVITHISNYSNCSSSSERSSVSKCMLLCSVLNVRDVNLSWYKGNSLLSSISVSDLNIRLSLPLEVEYQDTNTYRCVVNNPIKNQTQHLNITKLCESCSAKITSFNLTALILSLLLLLLVIIGVSGLVYWKCKNGKQAEQQVETIEEEIHYATTTFCARRAHSTEADGPVETIYSSVLMS
ncbi:natural killer cell receptor 2B4-like isoform X3 [Paramisgurnus dabryanus]|uniref:natural killer cell receptor 2B4-like isoform X3 n=1 Tax=Paramisgurnus dabryanus TaxID=90735 RepID=UPI0031F45DD3